jgi:integral membrane protein
MTGLLWAGRLEGISLLLLLFVAMPLKYMLHEPFAVRVVGAVHGILFILYAWLIIHHTAAGRFGVRQAGLLLLGSFLPFGTFWTEKVVLVPRR